MSIRRLLFAFPALLAGAACAQAAPPLKLDLPPEAAGTHAEAAQPGSAPAAGGDASTQAVKPVAPLPPLPTMAGADAPPAKPACDDGTYGQAQVHGGIGMGVVAGSRVSGSYETGNVQVSKALGSCDDPTGYVGLSISVGQGNVDRRHHRGRRVDPNP